MPATLHARPVRDSGGRLGEDPRSHRWSAASTPWLGAFVCAGCILLLCSASAAQETAATQEVAPSEGDAPALVEAPAPAEAPAEVEADVEGNPESTQELVPTQPASSQGAAAPPLSTADAPSPVENTNVSVDAAPSAEETPETPEAPGTTSRLRGYWVGGQVHAVFISALIDREPLQLSAGFALSGGIEFERAGLTLTIDNTWFPEAELAEDSEEIFTGVAQGVIAFLFGFDVHYASDRLRFQLSAGPTVLLRNTLVDTAGTIGLAVDSRPVGVRVPLPSNRTLVVDPLSFSLMIPDLSGIPLLLLQFRTTVTLEFDFAS